MAIKDIERVDNHLSFKPPSSHSYQMVIRKAWMLEAIVSSWSISCCEWGQHHLQAPDADAKHSLSITVPLTAPPNRASLTWQNLNWHFSFQSDMYLHSENGTKWQYCWTLLRFMETYRYLFLDDDGLLDVFTVHENRQAPKMKYYDRRANSIGATNSRTSDSTPRSTRESCIPCRIPHFCLGTIQRSA